MPGTYDPELHLLYWGIGNPNPVHAGQGRRGAKSLDGTLRGAQCCIAVNWHGISRPSPHDTDDWDATQTAGFGRTACFRVATVSC